MTTRDRENKQNKNQTAPVVLVEVQPEAEEAQALVWAVDQQHQEVLDDALRAEEGGEDHVLCTLENPLENIRYYCTATMKIQLPQRHYTLQQHISNSQNTFTVYTSTHAHIALEMCLRTENQ